jgi:hypothetical protein
MPLPAALGRAVGELSGVRTSSCSPRSPASCLLVPTLGVLTPAALRAAEDGEG